MNYLVTGCSRGVGLEICKVLLEQNHCVYGIARSYTDEFKALEKRYADKLFFKSVDLADLENIRKIIFRNSGKLLFVPYTKDFGRITQFWGNDLATVLYATFCSDMLSSHSFSKQR